MTIGPNDTTESVADLCDVQANGIDRLLIDGSCFCSLHYLVGHR
jgi:hypothetical protein